MIYSAYKETHKCKIIVGMVFNLGTTTFEIGLPYLLGWYIHINVLKADGNIDDFDL
jgi:hypothetical protein